MVKAAAMAMRSPRPFHTLFPEAPMRRTLMLSSLYAVSLAMLILPYGLMN